MKSITKPFTYLAIWTASVGAALVACSGSGGGEKASAGVTVTGEVPLVYVQRAVTLRLNPTNGAPFAAGGDLMLREKSSPSAPEHNLTAGITQGAGDVSDPEVSYDGRKIVFALRCPTSNSATIGTVAACTGRWNLWEYTLGAAPNLHQGTLRRLTAAADADDVDPAWLPGGRGFVFTSNRQTRSRTLQALGRNYLGLDEYERERVFNLHTMGASGEAIQQISFNQSHDRNPVVRPNGDILFSRWDHVGGRNQFSIFRMRPDGTDLFVLYGAHSAGNSFLHPRDMDPAGAFKGQLATSLMPLSGTQEGGALMLVDAAGYSEQNTPASPDVPAEGGQRQLTQQVLQLGGGLSPYGRATTPYPLWDGTDRILVAWRPCEVTRAGVVVPCANLTDAERERLASERSNAEAEADELQANAPAAYGIYMFDPARQTWLNVASPPPGFMLTDPVAILARPEPAVVEGSTVDATLAAQGLGLMEVRSVYDTDGLGRMGDAVIAPFDTQGGCSDPIPKTAPTDRLDLRRQVADIARLKNPADAAYRCAPARFLRVVRAVAPPASSMGLRSVIGDTEFEQQQILGYVPIEPDGSVKLTVPADTPLALAVVDAKGRAFQTHTNWIQLRPGERRTCDGCHSPRRGGALNSGAIVDTQPDALRKALSAQRLAGETLAGTRTRLDGSVLALAGDPVDADVWADTTRPGVAAKPAVSLRYVGNPRAADDLATVAPQQGIINYEQHIQPLWSRDRGSATCTGCHNADAPGNSTTAPRLDLSATIAGTGRLASYEALLTGPPLIDAATGQVRTRLDDGVPVVVRGPALVDTGAGNTLGMARSSRLMEILSGDTLKVGSGARSAYPVPTPSATVPDHARLLNAAEQRLLAEWMDLGGQYANDPFDASGRVRSIGGVSAQVFGDQVLPVLNARCLGCHQTGRTGVGRLVLTGDGDGDFNVVLSFVNDACNPANSTLLKKASTRPHPAAATAQTAPPLPAGSAEYQAVAAWIAGGCGR